MTRYAIIGDGGAGTTAAFYIRQSDPNAEIEIYSDDPNAAYYRAALTNYLIGELREAQLFATPPDFYQTNNIKRILTRVVSLDGKKSRFTLDDGTDIAFDQLLIASGARPNEADFKGANLKGVMTMRTLRDARRVMDLLSGKRIKQAVVVGGGPLGIEWVQGLLHHHVKVTYLLRGDMFFERALDRTASDLVISRLRAEGVDVITNEEIGEALASRDGRVRAIRLKNSGKEIECQLVGTAIGIRPNVEFLEGSGVDVAVDPKRGTAQGIKVDEMMRSNIENIYAAGDIIYRTLGLWEPARLQGRVAGRNMAGGSDVYQQGVHYNATRLYDLDFASVGELAGKDGDQILIDFPRGKGQVSYRKLMIRENKLIGAIMLGQRKEHVRKYGLQYRKLINEKVDVSDIANHLIDPSFDLASWIDLYKIEDKIDSARQIQSQNFAPSIANMRMTRNEISSMVVKQPSVVLQEPEKAVLLYGNSKTELKKVTKIGRSPENDIVIQDPEVSGEHAQIRSEGSNFMLEDTGSRNGTFLNKVKISQPTPLVSGALIQVGKTEIQFMFGKPPENLRMTSAGLPEAPLSSPELPSDIEFGYLQLNGNDIPLRMLSANLGRDANADIILDDPAVSYKHALLTQQGDASYLLDLGSRNGTFVNAERISIPYLLKNGDVIKLGETSLVFRTGSVPSSKREIIKPPPVSLPEKRVEETVPLEITLTVQNGNMSGKTIFLKQSPTSLGRDPQNHIVIDEDIVSWNHAEFKQENTRWFVKDNGSSNHTFINEEKIIPHEYFPIKAGDKLRFGKIVLEVTQNAS